MTVLRFLAGLFLIAALIAFVDDVTRTLIGAGHFSPTSLGKLWTDTAPKTLLAVKSAVNHGAGAILWNGVISKLLQMPTFALLGVIGGVLGYLGRRRHRIEIYTN